MPEFANGIAQGNTSQTCSLDDKHQILQGLMETKRRVIILDAANGVVSAFEHDKPDTEDAVHSWCEQTGNRYGEIDWMEWDGKIHAGFPVSVVGLTMS